LGDDEALKKKQGFRGRMIIAGTFGSVITAATYLWLRDEARNEDIEEIVVSR
jgi:cardiolipin synthase